jgi:hypothetical protein
MERETAAAILVQTIFASSDHLRVQLAAQAEQNPTAAADYLWPYYLEAFRALKKVHQEMPGTRNR